MKQLVWVPETFVWFLLTAATCLSWYMGTGQNADTNVTYTAIALMLVAFFKVRLVIIHFMEIGHAPLPLRLICEGWVVATCSAVLITYLVM